MDPIDPLLIAITDRPIQERVWSNLVYNSDMTTKFFIGPIRNLQSLNEVNLIKNNQCDHDSIRNEILQNSCSMQHF